MHILGRVYALGRSSCDVDSAEWMDGTYRGYFSLGASLERAEVSTQGFEFAEQ
jgi:hypothetical protein